MIEKIVGALALGAALGAFIDFYIGKDGQKRWRAKLAQWWKNYYEIRWMNVGQHEIQFFLDIIDAWFGPRLFSVQRLVVTSATFFFFLIFAVLLLALEYGFLAVQNLFKHRPLDGLRYWAPMLVSCLWFAVSISYTQFVSRWVVKQMSPNALTNLVLLIGLLLLHLITLLIWPSMVIILRDIFVSFLDRLGDGYLFFPTPPPLERFFDELEDSLILSKWFFENLPVWVNSHLDKYVFTGPFGYNIVRPVLLSFDLTPNIIRLFISALFFFGYIFRPLLERPTLIVIGRLIQSDKPLATTVTACVFGAGKTAQEAAKVFF